MKKKSVKKLQLHRETLTCLDLVKGGVGKEAGFGTHYRSICADLCQDTDPVTEPTD